MKPVSFETMPMNLSYMLVLPFLNGVYTIGRYFFAAVVETDKGIIHYDLIKATQTLNQLDIWF